MLSSRPVSGVLCLCAAVLVSWHACSLSFAACTDWNCGELPDWYTKSGNCFLFDYPQAYLQVRILDTFTGSGSNCNDMSDLGQQSLRLTYGDNCDCDPQCPITATRNIHALPDNLTFCNNTLANKRGCCAE